jgi:hypothetical protein
MRIKQAAEVGDGDALVALAIEITSSARQAGMADVERRLMGLTQKAAPYRVREIAQILVQAGTPAFAPYGIMLSALDAAAPLEPGVEAFMANRHKAKEILHIALHAAADVETTSQMLRLRLARVLWQMGDEEGLAELVGEVVSRAKFVEHNCVELAKLGISYGNTRNGRILREAICVAVEREQGSPDVLHAHMRGLVADGQPIDSWWALLKKTVADHPLDIGLKRFAALCAYERGDWALAEDLYHGLALNSDKPVDWEKAGLAALRMGHDGRAVEWLACARPRVPWQTVGILKQLLERLLDAINRDYFSGDVQDYETMKQALDASVGHLQATLSRPTDYAPNELLQAAAAISTVEQYPFDVLSEIVGRNLYVDEWDARYGTFDLLAYRIVWRALLEHQAVLLDNGLKRMLEGSGSGSLNSLRDTAKSLVRVRLALDEPQIAIQTLQTLISAGCTGLFFQELLDECLLHNGQISEVNTRVRTRSSTNVAHTRVCRVAQTCEWVERERLETRVLWEEGPLEGRFEKAVKASPAEIHIHRTATFALRAIDASSVTLAGSEVLIGPCGTVLRPSFWHYPGIFPQRTGIARTAAASGVVLDLAEPERRVNEPVVLLACNDAVHVSNYFHWMNFVLTRCVFLVDQGLLQGRRLLMPAEIKPWMHEALELVGLSEDCLFYYSAHEVLHIAEATLITAFDYPGAEYIRRFRTFMWNAAKVSDECEAPATREHIFMGRPADSRRPFFGRDRILRIAQDVGFRCIDPADLSVADQVKLFSRAASVAGFGGAAFTNVAFCRPGISALEFTRRETTWPDYVGIALALGIQYRFCPGWIDPSAIGTRLVHDGPTRFDEALVERELKWLKKVTR